MSADLNKIFNEAIDIDRFLPKDKPVEAAESVPQIFCKLSVNPSANGSAYMEYDSIKVYCSVNGPSEMRQDGQLVTSFKFAPFAHQLLNDEKNEVEKRFSQLLLSALEPSIMLHCFPRGMYEVAALILDNGGQQDVEQCLAAVVTCAGMAMADAGTQMYDLPTAVNMNLNLFNNTSGSLCAAALPKLQQFSMIHTSGARMHDDSLLPEILKKAMDRCAQVRLTLRHFLAEHLQFANT